MEVSFEGRLEGPWLAWEGSVDPGPEGRACPSAGEMLVWRGLGAWTTKGPMDRRQAEACCGGWVQLY